MSCPNLFGIKVDAGFHFHLEVSMGKKVIPNSRRLLLEFIMS